MNENGYKIGPSEVYSMKFLPQRDPLKVALIWLHIHSLFHFFDPYWGYYKYLRVETKKFPLIDAKHNDKHDNREANSQN